MMGTPPSSRRHRQSLARAVAGVCLVPLLVAPALAQTLGQGGDDGISTWRVVAVLILCLCLAVFAAVALRARLGSGKLPSFFGAARQARRLQLIETLRLSHQIDLCIVACDGREMLVAASARGARLLQPEPAGAAAPTDERA